MVPVKSKLNITNASIELYNAQAAQTIRTVLFGEWKAANKIICANIKMFFVKIQSVCLAGHR